MSIEKRAESIMVCIANIYNTGGVIQNDDFKFIANQVEEIKKEIADVQPIVDTKNMATVSDEFICKKCGLYLKDYIKVVMDEDNDGYIDEQHYDYEPKFCPECGAEVKDGDTENDN